MLPVWLGVTRWVAVQEECASAIVCDGVREVRVVKVEIAICNRVYVNTTIGHWPKSIFFIILVIINSGGTSRF